MTLQFYVNNQTLSLSPAQKDVRVAASSRNYLKARFNFQTPEWKRATLIYALFTQNGLTYKKILGVEPGMKFNECYVSPEVLNEGEFSVSIYCDDLITTTQEVIKVDPSGYTEDIANQDTTPSVLEQMETMMYQYASLCNQIYEACEQIKNELKGE